MVTQSTRHLVHTGLAKKFFWFLAQHLTEKYNITISSTVLVNASQPAPEKTKNKTPKFIAFASFLGVNTPLVPKLKPPA